MSGTHATADPKRHAEEQTNAIIRTTSSLTHSERNHSGTTLLEVVVAGRAQGLDFLEMALRPGHQKQMSICGIDIFIDLDLAKPIKSGTCCSSELR